MSDQTKLDIKAEPQFKSVEQYKFEPIKGYPMLQWKGKRPFTSTQYYPAQLKENHGEPVNNWMNRIYWGDNLQVMAHLLKEFRGKVDLVYVDPPFDSKADYKQSISLKGKTVSNDSTVMEEKQYSDIWTNDTFLQFTYERLVLIRELLADHGTLFVHCDWHKSHHIRCILDEVFGPNGFANEIQRLKCNPKNSNIPSFGNIHDTIFLYRKSEVFRWNPQREAKDSEDLQRIFEKSDPDGRRYTTVALHAPGERKGETGQPWRNISPPKGRHWACVHAELDRFEAEKKIEWSDSGNPRLKRYADEDEGDRVQDIWTMKDPQYVRYPTEKSSALLRRIVSATTNPGDLVFDCFMGSGTTQAAAMQLGRRFIGADINLGAIQTSTKRLLFLASQLLQKQRQQLLDSTKELGTPPAFTGFSIFNVNHYDVFRNPAQAKDLIIEALEIQPLPSNALYDGEKDGRMVKIMPINRIATKADINDLLTGFDYKAFQKRREQSPSQPVESLLLVCMGHEPDLAAHLKRECQGFDLDVEVVDILRDKANLEFKRDSQAEIKIEKGVFKIAAFYPMNLLQKLSLMKENVGDWRELTESIMIDWNYDGAVFEPKLVDVPEKEEFVKGEYSMPKDAGTIRVKITDLLSESLEMEVSRG
jgi:adenine-specific DNA-methyltransferase